MGGDSGPVKDRYRDSGDEENKISSWGKTERIAANDSKFRRVWCSVKKLLADADMQARSSTRSRKQSADARMAISFAARAPVCICLCRLP